jgi:site-specific recombinase XerC
MINRTNWKLLKEYLTYRGEVDHISRSSQHLEETWLRHLLEWAKEYPFEKVITIRPTFPEYVLTARMDGGEGLLSPVYIQKVIRSAYRFLKWLKVQKRGYSIISQAYLDTLQPPRMTIEEKEHEAVSLEEIRQMANAPVSTIGEKRIRASAVFWFLSGIRIGAFVSLPLLAVDIDNLEVKQWPKLGVRTKFMKHATTYLLNIPDLLDVVREWDKEVRTICGNEGLWFAQVSPETGKIIPGAIEAGMYRASIAARDLRFWLKKVNLPFHSPHKFRHGNAIYSLKLAKDIGALKAISQNLMHSNISITDGIYGILSNLDVKGQIDALNRTANIRNSKTDMEELKVITKRLLELFGDDI